MQKQVLRRLWPLLLWLGSPLHAATVNVYLGSASKTEPGIYRTQLDLDTGRLSPATQVNDVVEVKFLSATVDQQSLYAVVSQQSPQQPIVAAYKIAQDGALLWLNSQPVDDAAATHISVHPSGKLLLTAHYGGQSVSVFPLDAQGQVGPKVQSIKHTKGSMVVPKRQRKPHPHWVGFSPDQRFAFVPDLGKDQVVIYQVDVEAQRLKWHGALDVPPGAGPRHMRFSVDGRFIFVLNELQLSVSTFAYEPSTGEATLLSTTPTLSEAIKQQEHFNSASEILVHPNGRFVYTANRGHDSVSVFEFNPATGSLRLLEVEPIRGSWPRSINLDPSGRWLLAAGAKSNTLTVFQIDSDSGLLSFPTGSIINVPAPITIEFAGSQP